VLGRSWAGPGPVLGGIDRETGGWYSEVLPRLGLVLAISFVAITGSGFIPKTFVGQADGSMGKETSRVRSGLEGREKPASGAGGAW
ncbi:MAG: hypothetical protein ACRDJF_04545, partial [Actinomycetota bacterium]